MQMRVEERGDVRVVHIVEAKLTYPVLSAFFAEVRQLVEGGAKKVIIELSAVSYIDSASIGCLMDIHRLLQERAGVVRLAGLQPRVETMISMTGVHKIVDIHRDEEDAVAAFASRKTKGKGDA
jgi:anti-sigma B factor antagonist